MNEKTRIDFLIRLYFGKGTNYIDLAINRAYRDFSRTLRNLPKGLGEWETLKEKLSDIIKEEVLIILQTQMVDQEKFNIWHLSFCEKLEKASDNILKTGQSQKWINMTLKYLLTFGEEYVPGITSNYRFFHIPIDNIIQKAFKEEPYCVEEIEGSWSRIDNYATYNEYQIAIRNAIGDLIPIEVEFELFTGLSTNNNLLN